MRRVDEAGAGARPGDFLVAPGSEAALAEVARATGVDFAALAAAPAGAHDLTRLRIGMYQRYYGGNMDEGWTRLVLEQFGFPYTTLMDAEIKAGSLNAKYDVIILPDDSTSRITGESAGGGRGGGFGGSPASVPPEYRSGIGNDGVKALQDFVTRGGRLVLLGGASSFGIEKFGLSVRNVLDGVPPREFYCPGSTLHAIFDTADPLAYGMPGEGLLLFWNSQAFEIAPTDMNENYRIVARFPERDLLESGWLVGEARIAKKAAMVSAKYGEGEVVLIGFRTQARAQTHGTFKLLFNALVK
jgi:hypothetical protein